MIKDQGIAERVADTQQVPAALLTEKPPFPARLKIELTARCDLQCYFCSLTYKARTKGDIDSGLLYRILREARQLGVQDLGLFWLGEPLLVKELPEYVACAKAIGIPYVFITTNGRRATPERMRQLMASGIDSIKFSFNAVTREQYLAVTGVDAFDQVVDNIRAAWTMRGDRRMPKLYASTVCDRATGGDFEAAHQLIGAYVDQHYPLRRYGVQASESRDTRILSDMLPCWSLFTEPHISYDGHMSACFCDHDPKFHMGDLHVMSLIEAWHSPQFVELRKRHLSKDIKGTPCAECIAYAH